MGFLSVCARSVGLCTNDCLLTREFPIAAVSTQLQMRLSERARVFPSLACASEFRRVRAVHYLPICVMAASSMICGGKSVKNRRLGNASVLNTER